MAKEAFRPPRCGIWEQLQNYPDVPIAARGWYWKSLQRRCERQCFDHGVSQGAWQDPARSFHSFNRLSHDALSQISIRFCRGDPLLSRARHPRLGRVCRLFLAPGPDCPCDHNLLFVGCLAPQQRKCEPGRARGSRQSLGARILRANRAPRHLSAGLYRPDGVLDDGWGGDPVARRCSVRGRWRAADLAGICARSSIQRIRCHRVCAGHRRYLWCRPQPQLPRKC